MTSVAARSHRIFATSARPAVAVATSHPRRVGGVSNTKNQNIHATRQKSHRGWVRARAGAEGAAASADPAEVYAIREGSEDDGTALVSAAAWLEARDSGSTASGVYALYDASGSMQFVGYARDAVDAVRRQRDGVGDARANKVRVAVFANKAMATRQNLRAEADRWILEWVQRNGGDDSAVPPGNQAMYAAQWALPAEVWDAEPAPVASPATVGPDGQVISPFAPGEDGELTAGRAGARNKEAGAVGGAGEGLEDPDRQLLPLTKENVDVALDEVRPFLIADGGNVEVVGIEDGIVAVRMTGACGSCSSSYATLKGGIEKTLLHVFGSHAVKEVVNLDSSEPGSALSLSRQAVESHLEKLSGAIHNYGGAVTVLDVTDGTCLLEYSGPVALAQSIASSIKGKFPLVRECKIKQV